jgi:transcriptional regulator with XRE-family HTH domain
MTTQITDHFQEFISDPKRRRIYEREALAFDASELISKLMEDDGVNKSELATRAGTSKSHITSLLSGSRNMTLHTLADLTFVLGYKVEINATPLCAVACWTDFDDQGVDAYAGGWGLVHSNKYKAASDQYKAPEAAPQQDGCPLPSEECLMVA